MNMKQSHPIIHRTIKMHACALLLSGVIASGQALSPEVAAPAETPSAPSPFNPSGSGKWKADYYRALVIYDGENKMETDEGIKAIQNKIDDKVKSLNLSLMKISSSDKNNLDDKTAEVLKILNPEKFPFTIIYFPENSDLENPLWTGNMTSEEAGIIGDSPARREIARRLLKGESAVWLLIEAGIDYKDYRILKLLSEEIKNIGNAPSAAANPLPPEADGKKEGGSEPKSQGRMSIVRISRDDAAEKTLLKMIADIEPEIMNVSNDPVLVPVYARGRILGLMSNDEISRESIKNKIELILGGGADREKGLSSGTALLLSVDWDAFAGGKLAIDEELPALKDFSGKFSLDDVFPTENPPPPDLGPVAADKERSPAVKAPFPMKIINLILISIIVALVLLFFAVVMRSRR